MILSAGETVRQQKYFIVLLCLLIGILYAGVIPGMVQIWIDDPNYSHGFFIPLIAGYFFFQRWHETKETPVTPSHWGILPVIFSLLLLVFGISGTEYFTMRFSLVVLLAGLTVFLFGWQVFEKVVLPIAFLVFMVPLPYIVYDAAAFPLKLAVAKISVLLLKTFGVIVWREGNIIMFPVTTLEVADACSGLRSLISLIALSVALAFLSLRQSWKRMTLILLAIPIAIITNIFRVVVTGFLAQYYGAAAAEGFFHEFAGLAVFGLAMVLLFGAGVVLRKF